MDPTIRDLLRSARTIAVVGASTNPEKAAASIPQRLIEEGYEVHPVHPSAEEILGRTAYRSLADVPGPIDIVDVFRPAAEAPDVARQAVEAGAGAVWLQLGIRSDEARRTAEEAGLTYVEDQCLGQRAAELRHQPD